MISEEALREIREEGVLSGLVAYGKPLFLVVTGAHGFGFPSVNSDIDVRGIYAVPNEKLLGMRQKREEPSFILTGKGKKLDLLVEEVGHFIRLVSESNGSRLEWLNSPLVVSSYNGFEQLRQNINAAGISKGLANHYLHFARDMWHGDTKEEGVKKDLYALRAYMVGIHALERGEIVSDIRKLNEGFGYKIIDDMIRVKERGEEQKGGYDEKKVEQVVYELDQRLVSAIETSKLPAEPDTKKLNQILIDLRRTQNHAA